jgi:hypothetical protein
MTRDTFRWISNLSDSLWQFISIYNPLITIRYFVSTLREPTYFSALFSVLVFFYFGDNACTLKILVEHVQILFPFLYRFHMVMCLLFALSHRLGLTLRGD